MSTETTTERAKLDFSFDDELNNDEKTAISLKVEEISEQAGFKARVTPKITTDAVAADTPKLDRRARTRTGRTYPFNTKIKPETYDAIAALSDHMSQQEGRYVSLAEVIEKGIELLKDTR